MNLNLPAQSTTIIPCWQCDREGRGEVDAVQIRWINGRYEPVCEECDEKYPESQQNTEGNV